MEARKVYQIPGQRSVGSLVGLAFPCGKPCNPCLPSPSESTGGPGTFTQEFASRTRGLEAGSASWTGPGNLWWSPVRDRNSPAFWGSVGECTWPGAGCDVPWNELLRTVEVVHCAQGLEIPIHTSVRAYRMVANTADPVLAWSARVFAMVVTNNGETGDRQQCLLGRVASLLACPFLRIASLRVAFIGDADELPASCETKVPCGLPCRVMRSRWSGPSDHHPVLEAQERTRHSIGCRTCFTAARILFTKRPVHPLVPGARRA